jgi:hypothetical protein
MKKRRHVRLLSKALKVGREQAVRAQLRCYGHAAPCDNRQTDRLAERHVASPTQRTPREAGPGHAV